MKKIQILIVDDHQLIRESWAIMLNSDLRFNVVDLASDGEQAISKAKSTQPDIVLMDINMNGMDGVEATKAIKDVSPLSKVIGVSLFATPVYARKMIGAGAMGYVTKNSGKEELIMAILEVQNGNTYICEEIKNIFINQELKCDDTLNSEVKPLSKREIEIVQFVKNGFSSREIASQLGITSKTVEVHRYNILKKLSLSNTAALVNFAHHNGI